MFFILPMYSSYAYWNIFVVVYYRNDLFKKRNKKKKGSLALAQAHAHVGLFV